MIYINAILFYIEPIFYIEHIYCGHHSYIHTTSKLEIEADCIDRTDQKLNGN